LGGDIRRRGNVSGGRVGVRDEEGREAERRVGVREVGKGRKKKIDYGAGK